MAFDFSLTDVVPDTPEIVIVHIGASILPDFTEPYAALVAGKCARVVGFEPNPQEHAKLIAQYGEGYTFLPYFIGKGGPATYYETNFPFTGSLLEPNTALLERFQNLGELTQIQATHPVATHTLDSIPELTHADYIKIDVQGAELDVFRNGAKLLADCMLVETEVEFVPLYKEQPLFADLDIHLRACGFQLHTLQHIQGRAFKPLMKHGKPNAMFNQMLWADAVYVRDFMAWDTLQTDKLLKLAVLLHDIYKSVDLCIVALAELDRRAATGPVLQGAYMNRLQAG